MNSEYFIPPEFCVVFGHLFKDNLCLKNLYEPINTWCFGRTDGKCLLKEFVFFTKVYSERYKYVIQKRYFYKIINLNQF